MNSLTPDETFLGLLAIHAQHGYELLERFRNTSQLGRVWNLSTSQLYAVLKRLERQGWITGQALPSNTAPTRIEYTLTPSGEARLFAWLYEEHPSASIRRIRVEFLSRLFIAQQLNLPTGHIMQRQRAACEHKYTELITERNRSKPGIDLLALELHISQLEAVLRWFERLGEIIPTK